jgi:hypothetical protein
MSRHNTIRASLAITAAAFAIGATSAGAMPTQDGSPAAKGPHAAQFYDAGHASLAIERAHAQASAQDTLATEGVAPGADLRGESAKDAALASGQATQPVFQGPPKFSSTKVAALHSTQLAAKDDGNDVPLLGIILGLAGAGILGAGAAFAVSKTTRSRRTRVVA